jgi:Zn-dependent protease/CBS domain-containing protein
VKSFQLLRVAGIGVEIHPSWLVILGLVSWTLAEGAFPDWYEDWSEWAYWTVGVAAAVLLFVTVLLHELAHALVAKKRGVDVPKITLFIFGGVSHLSEQPKTAREEFAIAIAGPLTSFAIAIVTGLVAFFATGGNEKVEGMFGYLASINVTLGVFNLLPGFPLDGGRVLRSIVWGRTQSFQRATRAAAGVGQLFAYALITGGIVLLLFGGALQGLWLFLIAWFLLGAARNEVEDFPQVLPNISIAQVVDEHVLGHGARAVVVSDERGALGILSITDILKHPREQWAQVPAQTAMTPRDLVVTVDSDATAMEVLDLLARRRLGQVPVLSDGRMVGLVNRRDLVERVELAETMGLNKDGGGRPGAGQRRPGER